MIRNNKTIFPQIALLFFACLFIISGCKKDTMPPTVCTLEVTGVTQNSANCTGVIISDGGAKVTERGLCWSMGLNPSIDNNKIIVDTRANDFSGSITGLTPFTTYFVRAYATNKQGTSYGEIKMFSTYKLPAETIIDIDGNVYNTITIGTQVWMLENLKTTKFRNGDSIENIEIFYLWDVITPAYCNYDNDETLVPIYGRLYNWYAVNDSRGLAPAGWHIPSRTEWQTLIDYCGGSAVAGNKIKEDGFVHWNSPNTGATNESGFTALPGGYRFYDGSYDGLGDVAFFWTDTQFALNSAYFRDIQYNSMQVMDESTSKLNGASVRCIKD